MVFRMFGRCSAEYEVTIPDRTEVSVRTRTGGVDVTGIAAPVNVATATGEVRVAEATGEIWLADFQTAEIQATSVIGAIQVGSGFETVRVRSDTGSIKVTTDMEFRALTVTTALGDIDLRVPQVYQVRGYHCRFRRDHRGPVHGCHLRHRSGK